MFETKKIHIGNQTFNAGSKYPIQAQMIGLSKPGALHPVSPRCFQRPGHCVPLYFAAFGGKIQATRCAGGR
jgi:hypothetical protein